MNSRSKSEKKVPNKSVSQSEILLLEKIKEQANEISTLRTSLNYYQIKEGENKEVEVHEEVFDLENMDFEKKQIIQEVLKHYNEIKEDNHKLRKKSLHTIKQKEIEIIQLKEEINSLFHLHLSFKKNEENISEDENIVFTSDDVKELIDSYTRLTEENANLKSKLESIDNQDDNNGNEMKEYYKEQLSQMKAKIENLKNELNTKDNEIKEIVESMKSKNENHLLLLKDNEKLQGLVHNLEESKEKIEFNLKECISKLYTENSELNTTNNLLRDEVIHLKKELENTKTTFSLKNREFKESLRSENMVKMIEENKFKTQFESLKKEFELEKFKVEKIMNKYEKEKLEKEKLKDQVSRLSDELEREKKMFLQKIEIIENTPKKGSLGETILVGGKRKSIAIVPENGGTCLEEVLDDEVNEIQELKEEITQLEHELSQSQIRIQELEKENQNYKELNSQYLKNNQLNSKGKNCIENLLTMKINEIEMKGKSQDKIEDNRNGNIVESTLRDHMNNLERSLRLKYLDEKLKYQEEIKILHQCLNSAQENLNETNSQYNKYITKLINEKNELEISHNSLKMSMENLRIENFNRINKLKSKLKEQNELTPKNSLRKSVV